MLSTPTAFPHAGSTGYLRGTATPARIIQQRGDGRLLVTYADDVLPQLRHHRTIDATEICRTAQQALTGTRQRRRA